MLSYLGAVGIADVVRELEKSLFGTRCFISGQLAIGATKTKVNLAAAVDYCIDGVIYHKAITNDCFAHTDVTVQPDLTTKLYLLCLDSSGNGSIVAGNAYTVDALGVETSSYGSAKLPPVPASKCPVGYLKIVTNGTTFTPATSDHDKANVTTTYVNLSCIPASV